MRAGVESEKCEMQVIKNWVWRQKPLRSGAESESHWLLVTAKSVDDYSQNGILRNERKEGYYKKRTAHHKPYPEAKFCLPSHHLSYRRGINGKKTVLCGINWETSNFCILPLHDLFPVQITIVIPYGFSRWSLFVCFRKLKAWINVLNCFPSLFSDCVLVRQRQDIIFFLFVVGLSSQLKRRIGARW